VAKKPGFAEDDFKVLSMMFIFLVLPMGHPLPGESITVKKSICFVLGALLSRPRSWDYYMENNENYSFSRFWFW
jgi:hypothetical protein